jgi:hypothetical protein
MGLADKALRKPDTVHLQDATHGVPVQPAAFASPTAAGATFTTFTTEKGDL